MTEIIWTELPPCPACGSTFEVYLSKVYMKDGETYRWWLSCNRSECEESSGCVYARSEEEALTQLRMKWSKKP